MTSLKCQMGRLDKTNKMTCAPSEDSDQPGHPPSLIRVFAVRMKKHWVLSYPLSALQRLWSDWASALSDLSLRWVHRSFCWFCLEVLHLPSLIRVFAVRMEKHWVLSYPLSALWRLWSDWAAVLSLRWAHRSFCWFCHEAAQMDSSNLLGQKSPLGTLKDSNSRDNY